MKVREFIKELQELDPELEIQIWEDDDSSGYGRYGRYGTPEVNVIDDDGIVVRID